MMLWTEGFPTWTKKAEQVVKNCSMTSFQDLVCPGHYKVTMEHHLLLRSPKGSLKHWALLIIYIVPGDLRSSGKVERANQFLKSVIRKR